MSFPYELIPKLHHSMLSTDEKEKVPKFPTDEKEKVPMLPISSHSPLPSNSTEP